ncbi:MAG: hypothetical protein AB7S26_08160 [Sandaracinaceae bacterium]
MSIPEFLLDRRVVERNIARGLLDRAQAQKAIEALPDVESNSVPCALEVPSADAHDELGSDD